MSKMNEKEARDYLKKKGRLVKETTKEEAEAKNNEEVQKVMKKGKIYGDPIAEVQF